MNRQRVQSSNIRSVGYESTTHTFEIEFHSGGIYKYFDVPESVHVGLLNAASKGSYFHDQIKDRYRYRRVE
jgi:hypothetical protein